MVQPLDMARQPQHTARELQPTDSQPMVRPATGNLPTARPQLLHCTTTSLPLHLLLRRRSLPDMVPGLPMVRPLPLILTQQHLPMEAPHMAAMVMLTEVPTETPMAPQHMVVHTVMPMEVPTEMSMETLMVPPHMVAHTAMPMVVFTATPMVPPLTAASTVMLTAPPPMVMPTALLAMVLPPMVISTISTDIQLLVPTMKLTTQALGTVITSTKPLQDMEPNQPMAQPLDMVKPLPHMVRPLQDMALSQSMDNQPMVRLATVNLPTARPLLLHCTTSLQLLQAMDSQPLLRATPPPAPMVLPPRAIPPLLTHTVLPLKRATLQQAPMVLLLRRATPPQAPMALPPRVTPPLLTPMVLPARRATHRLQANTEPVITLMAHQVNTLEPQLPPLTTLALEATVSSQAVTDNSQAVTVNSQAAMARILLMEAQEPMDHSSPLARLWEPTPTLMYSTMDQALTSSLPKAMRLESTKRQARLALFLASSRRPTRPRSELWTSTKLRSPPKTLRCTRTRWI